MSGNGKVADVENGNGPGRPRIELSDADLDLIEEHAGEMTADQLADLLGISRTTLFNRINDTDEVSVRYKRGRAERIKKIASRLTTRALAGDITAMIFYLKTQAGWKETSRTELTGADGGPVEFTDDDRRDLASRIDRIAQARGAASVPREPQPE